MEGLDESGFQDLVGKIGEGATNSLDDISMDGYDPGNPPSELTEKINSGASEGFTKIKINSSAA